MKQQIFELIAKHDGKWGWYNLDRFLSTFFSPPGREMMTAIDDLIREGLIENRAPAGRQPKYFLTELGRKQIESGAPIPSHS